MGIQFTWGYSKRYDTVPSTDGEEEGHWRRASKPSLKKPKRYKSATEKHSEIVLDEGKASYRGHMMSRGKAQEYQLPA